MRPTTICVLSAAAGAVAAVVLVGGGLGLNYLLTRDTQSVPAPTQTVVVPLFTPPVPGVDTYAPAPSEVPFCVTNPSVICLRFV